MLDEETELAEKYGVFFDSVSDLVPQNWLNTKIYFLKEWELNSISLNV